MNGHDRVEFVRACNSLIVPVVPLVLNIVELVMKILVLVLV